MNCLFFDIETVPDADRLPLFAEDLDAKAWDAVNKEGAEINEEDAATLHAKKVQLIGATTPEYLQIIGCNLGFDDAAPRSGWVGEVRDGGEPLTERDLLKAFWSSAKQAKHLIGFNCNRFDLPAIYVRSALLGVEPTVDIWAKKPWDYFTLDLMELRWPRYAGAQFQSLKALRRILSLPVPDEYADLLDMTGGDVGALWAAGDFETCRRYGELDIWTTRSLARHWAGYFYPMIMERGA